MYVTEAKPATSERYELAEGPIWDERLQRLLWVDINAGHVHIGHLHDDGTLRVATTLRVDSTVGAVALSERRDELIVAGAARVMSLLRTGATEITRLIGGHEARRLNDGKCDPLGRFIVGTAPLIPSRSERLMMIDPNGTTSVLDEDLQLSNGLAWIGSRMYSIDTGPGIIWCRDLDVRSGSYGPRREAFRICDGSPDGMTADSQGNLWIAVWGAEEVRRYSPAGELLMIVRTPGATNPTSATFAGSDLNTLLITTAHGGGETGWPLTSPDAGAIYSADLSTTGTTGTTATRWGSPSLVPRSAS